jgi:hypothetical protein
MSDRSVPPRERPHDYAAQWWEYLRQLEFYEARKRRPLLPSERDYFTRQYYAPDYRDELRSLGCEDAS